MELHTQFLFTQSFNYVSEKELNPLIFLNEEIIKMLYGMVSKKE